MLVRVVPVGPFSMINVVAGASHIGWRDFLLGSVIGLAPGILLTAAFIDRALAALAHPGPTSFALLGAVALLIATVAWIVRRKLDRVAPLIVAEQGAAGHAA